MGVVLSSLTLSFNYSKVASKNQGVEWLALAEVEGFGEVGSIDDVGAVKVGDGLGDFDDLKIGASGEIELFGG